MADEKKGTIDAASDGGVSGQHQDPGRFQFLVGPTTSNQFNTARLWSNPIACWRVDDIRFGFDSSFVNADPTPDNPNDIRAELANLVALLKLHPNSPLSVFGHADPVGKDAYNKDLSGRRAMVIYGLLTANGETARAVNLWQHVAGAESWDKPVWEAMQQLTGLSRTTPHATLIQAYIRKLCPPELKLTKADFLARGADPQGKGDYQGCGEFNPLLLFSQEKQADFDHARQRNSPDDQATIQEENAANAPNRRVLVLIFRKGSKVDPAKWPCPSATDANGVAACKKRFWKKDPDGEKRRGTHLPGIDRQFTDKPDTFACRFYQRISDSSPCEGIAPPAIFPIIEIILDDDKDHVVDEKSPTADFVRIGLWDQAYNASGDVKNTAAEADNFVGSDFRRFYFRVTDSSVAARFVTIQWKTIKNDKSDDDAPASLDLTLQATHFGSKVFVSKAVMLVTEDTDRAQATDSGLTAPLPDVGARNQGQSNHRLRRAGIEGFVRGEYKAAGFPLAAVELPVFKRSPDERRRVSVSVINYDGSATAAYIADQFTHANQHWNRVGIQIDPGATVDRPSPPGVLNGAGFYTGSADNAPEQAALKDLIPIADDGTLTVVFVPLRGANAYSTIAQRNRSALGDRYFIFMNTTLALTDETLAHELHHVLFNRFDTAVARQFFTFNTTPPGSFGVALPDDRIYGRVQNLNSGDPDNDAANDNIINWARRKRSARFPIAAGTSAATVTTGNNFATQF